jgi:GMP synthase (glutamine-hydrolysing)
LTDGVTAGFYRFDMSSLWTTAARILNDVNGASRVAYDVTSKPPGTIAWK